MSRPGARRVPAVAGTGGRLVCQQKTCVCTCLWQVLLCDTFPSSPPDVRCCPIYRGGSSLMGDVPAFTMREVPYPRPFNLLHLAQAVLQCETLPSEGSRKSNLAFLLQAFRRSETGSLILFAQCRKFASFFPSSQDLSQVCLFSALPLHLTIAGLWDLAKGAEVMY